VAVAIAVSVPLVSVLDNLSTQQTAPQFNAASEPLPGHSDAVIGASRYGFRYFFFGAGYKPKPG
jgi:hypothetical protein